MYRGDATQQRGVRRKEERQRVIRENVSRLKFRRDTYARTRALAFTLGRIVGAGKFARGIGKYPTFHLENANCYPRQAGHFITEFPVRYVSRVIHRACGYTEASRG